MLSLFYQTVLPLSIAGSLTTLLLWGLTPAVKHLNNTWQYYVRLIAAALFLVPFSFALPALQYHSSTAVATDPAETLYAVSEMLDAALFPPPQQTVFLPLQFLAGAWVVGAILFALYKLFVWLNFCRLIRKSSKVITDNETLGLLEVCKMHRNIQRPVQLAVCERIGSPMLTGILHPAILLPHDNIPKHELRLILMHELTHHKRSDLPYKLLVLIVSIIHWFNPLAHLLAKQVSDLCELSCDEAVVRRMNSSERKAYGFAILNQISMKPCKCPEVSSGFSGSKLQIKRRLYFIMNFHKSKKQFLALGACVVVALSATGIIVASALNSDAQNPATDPAPDKSLPIAVTYSGAEDETQKAATVDGNGLPTDETPNDLVSIPAEQTEPKDGITEAQKAEIEKLSLIMPLEGQIVNKIWGYWGHTGNDIKADEGSDISAVADGTVVLADKMNGGYGKHVIISHGNNISTLYAHCKELLVKEGDVVKQGDRIATVGRSGTATGFHCHIELRIDGKYEDICDYVTD